MNLDSSDRNRGTLICAHCWVGKAEDLEIGLLIPKHKCKVGPYATLLDSSIVEGLLLPFSSFYNVRVGKDLESPGIQSFLVAKGETQVQRGEGTSQGDTVVTEWVNGKATTKSQVSWPPLSNIHSTSPSWLIILEVCGALYCKGYSNHTCTQLPMDRRKKNCDQSLSK